MSEAAKQQEVDVETGPCTACGKRSLVRKLAEVMGEVKRIAKNGRNDHFGYDFATEADIAEAVRDEMAKRHLMLFPDVIDEQWEKVPRKNGGETRLCTLTVRFTVEDGDSGETRVFRMKGQGEDALDKATYKAMTGAEKFALLKLFLIPTGNDPERVDSPVRYTPPRESKNEAWADAHQKAGTAPRKPASAGVELRAQYGSCKGQLPSEMTDKDLQWYLGNADKAVKAKTKWHESDLAWQAALQTEVAARVGPKAEEMMGKKSAPTNTSQRRAVRAQPDEPPPHTDADFFPGV